MASLSVVVAQSDARSAEALAATLHSHFRSVCVARTLDELRTAIPKHRANVAVVDLELASLRDIEQLRREFGDTTIVCTHRLPDEEMWLSVLAVGASDVCPTGDVREIVTATLRETRQLARSNAA